MDCTGSRNLPTDTTRAIRIDPVRFVTTDRTTGWIRLRLIPNDPERHHNVDTRGLR